MVALWEDKKLICNSLKIFPTVELVSESLSPRTQESKQSESSTTSEGKKQDIVATN